MTKAERSLERIMQAVSPATVHASSLSGRRFEIPPAHASWVDDGRVVEVSIGAHCLDQDWPWWTPGDIFSR